MPDHITLDINSYDHSTRSNAVNINSPDYLKYKSTERPNVVAFSNSFFYRSVTEWNKLPFAIRELSNYDIFKDNLKAHLWSILLAKPD